MEIDDVPFDDIPAAVTFAREAIAGGWWDGDWAESLLNKQTDPGELMAQLQELGGETGGQGARTRVRQALGDVAHELSDEEVDAVIAAATGDDDELGDDHMAELAALQVEFGSDGE